MFFFDRLKIIILLSYNLDTNMLQNTIFANELDYLPH